MNTCPPGMCGFNPLCADHHCPGRLVALAAAPADVPADAPIVTPDSSATWALVAFGAVCIFATALIVAAAVLGAPYLPIR